VTVKATLLACMNDEGDIHIVRWNFFAPLAAIAAGRKFHRKRLDDLFRRAGSNDGMSSLLFPIDGVEFRLKWRRESFPPPGDDGKKRND